MFLLGRLLLQLDGCAVCLVYAVVSLWMLRSNERGCGLQCSYTDGEDLSVSLLACVIVVCFLVSHVTSRVRVTFRTFD